MSTKFTETTDQENKEKIAKREREYQQTPSGKKNMLARSRAYYQTKKGKEKIYKRSKRWSKTEKGKISSRIRCARRRARLLNAGENFTVQDWKIILIQQKNRCQYCEKKFTEKLEPTIDHVIPLSKGGMHDPTNIVAACRSCNSKKHNRILDSNQTVNVMP